MDNFLNWISMNPTIATTIIVILGVLLLAMVVLFIVAFFQGREVSFYPPRIGELQTQKENNSHSIQLGDSQSIQSSLKSAEGVKATENNSFERVKGWAYFESEIREKLEKANEIRILKIKGRDIYKELPVRKALARRAVAKKFTRILLQNPQSKFVTSNIATEFEWSDFESYSKDFVHSLEMHSNSLPNYKDVVRLYDFLPILKIYILDDDIYISAYLGKVEEKEKKDEIDVWHFSRSINPFNIAQLIIRFFDALWDISRSPAIVPNKTVIMNENNGSLLIPVMRTIVNGSNKKKFLRNTIFFPKDEYHITIIGSKLGASLLEKMAGGDKREHFLNAVAEANWDYELSNHYFHLVKTETKSTTSNSIKQSIVQLVNIPALEGFYKKLEKIFDMPFPLCPSHITLFVSSEDKQGIGIYTQNDFEEYNHGEVQLSELKDFE